jgi:hypothetical protein
MVCDFEHVNFRVVERAVAKFCVIHRDVGFDDRSKLQFFNLKLGFFSRQILFICEQTCVPDDIRRARTLVFLVDRKECGGL